MPLEFALRPRFDLERSVPKRRRAGVPRFALLMAVYWLAVAGATVALLRTMKEEPDDGMAETAADLDRAPAEDPAPREEPAAVAEPAPEGVAAPAPAAALPSAPAGAPEPLLALAPPAATSEPRAVFSVPSRAEPREPEIPSRSEPRESQIPRRSEPRVAVRSSEPAARSDEPMAGSEQPVTLTREPASPRVKEQPASAPLPAVALPSCEAAAASANETLDLRGAPSGAPDLPREAFAAVLDDGAYLASCAPPARTALEICAAVQDGKVVGVSASSEPRNPALNACVRRAVAALRFPRSARLDVTRTRFDAAH